MADWAHKGHQGHPTRPTRKTLFCSIGLRTMDSRGQCLPEAVGPDHGLPVKTLTEALQPTVLG